MNKHLSSYWTWFYIFFVSLSILDYFDHILRPTQDFAKYPFDWFLFTFFSTITTLFPMYGLNYLLSKLTQKGLIIREIASVMFGISVHIGFTGNLYAKYFFPHTTVSFHFNWMPILAVVVFFLLIRFITIGIKHYCSKK